MIVFSVLLALMLNEVRNNWLETRQTRQLLANVKEEIYRNQLIVKKLVTYHQQVAGSVEAALENDSIRGQLIGNKGFNFFMLAPKGIIEDKINATSWDIALNSNIAIRTDFKTTMLLTELYDQQKLVKDAVNALIVIFESRDVHKKENLQETLILLRNLINELQGRENSLLFYYKEGLQTLADY
jgi:hypothetical protein